jgi:hypothetical protein
VTVYYTAVERYHGGDAETVTGCPTLNCKHGDATLGDFPSSFVRAVRDEGTGLTADGRYLNWSYDVGYWIDSAPRDTAGRPLEPFVSAAADSDVLPAATRFAITDCGTADDGSRPSLSVCSRLRAARWRILDEFTPGLGGTKHLDAYIGEETGPGFTNSPWYLTLTNATLAIS